MVNPRPKERVHEEVKPKPMTSSAKLMVEEEFDDNQEIEQAVPDAAQTNFKDSLTGEAVNEDSEPKKRGRGRPRKGEGPKKPVITPRKSGRREILEKKKEEDEKLRKERELEQIVLMRRERALELERQEEKLEKERQILEEQNAKLIEQGLQPIPIDYEKFSSKKRILTPKKPPTPRKKPRSAKSNKDPSEKRRGVGRPSKQENITKEVVSIFQMDDLEIFSDRETLSPNKKLSKTLPSNTSSPVPIDFENKGRGTLAKVPTISGIKRAPPPPAHDIDFSEAKKFTPFPVPEIDEEGNLTDPNFIKTHLSEVAASFDPNARLTDERAFFLEGSEGYFEQHSLRFRPSDNSLASSAPSLDYDEFIPIVSLGQLIHNDEKKAVAKRQRDLFHQWCFELSQGYNLNIFGVGSKASLIMEFVEEFFVKWYSETVQDNDQLPRVMVINGYNPSTKLKTVLHDIVSVVVTEEDKERVSYRMPKHVAEAFPFAMAYLRKNIVPSVKNGIIKPNLILVIHNIDGDPFRDDRSQNILSQLASLPNVWLIASTETINVGLLWDLYRFKNFNFLWHEATTYEALEVEMSFKDVLSMGKSKRFVGSKGAKYVLASLTTNARNLYKVISKMQMEKLEQITATKAARTGIRATAKTGLELKTVYEKCVQEYIASNEINFKTMLGEFVEHKMCSLVRNSAGVDIVFIPFSYDEIEKLLENEY